MRKRILISALTIVAAISFSGCSTSQLSANLGKITTAIAELPASTGTDITAVVKGAGQVVHDLTPKGTNAPATVTP